jgi:NAD(P)-dependent dehydrogenase (short-subunit alcohol dehydrogenase family)
MQSMRYAVITGAGSGLGRALAVALARQGWNIAIADINDEGGRQTLDAVRQAGGDGRVENLDVTKIDEWRALADKLRAEWPRLDLLVNNAGVGVAGEVGDLPLENWRWIMDINLWGVIYGCHAMIDWLKQNPDGAHIVNVASAAAIACAPGMAPYNVTKAGVLALSETLYGELKPHNIGVTGVCPAFFPTNILASGRFQTEAQQTMARRLMGGSKCTAEQVAGRIVRAIERRELYVMVPGVAGFLWRFKRLMPTRLLNRVARENARALAAAANKS